MTKKQKKFKIKTDNTARVSAPQAIVPASAVLPIPVNQTNNTPKVNKGGRPTKFRPEYCRQMIDFFSVPHTKIVTSYDQLGIPRMKEEANSIPFFSTFAHLIGVNGDTIVKWAVKYKKFNAAYKKCKEMVESMVVDNAMRDLYAQPFAIFFMKNCYGWRDRTEVEHSGQVNAVIMLPQAIHGEEGKIVQKSKSYEITAEK